MYATASERVCHCVRVRKKEWELEPALARSLLQHSPSAGSLLRADLQRGQVTISGD